jgi:hypothetical protein
VKVLLDPAARYGPMPPMGIFYRMARGELAVIGVIDARRLSLAATVDGLEAEASASLSLATRLPDSWRPGRQGGVGPGLGSDELPYWPP